jgi:hypothetical protein
MCVHRLLLPRATALWPGGPTWECRRETARDGRPRLPPTGVPVRALHVAPPNVPSATDGHGRGFRRARLVDRHAGPPAARAASEIFLFCNCLASSFLKKIVEPVISFAHGQTHVTAPLHQPYLAYFCSTVVCRLQWVWAARPERPIRAKFARWARLGPKILAR